MIPIIDSIAKAVASVSDSLRPWIDDHFQEKYELEHQERISEFNKIMGISDSHDLYHELSDFMLRLISKSGATVGRVDSSTISVPVDYFTALVSECSEGIKKDAIINKLEFKKVQ